MGTINTLKKLGVSPGYIAGILSRDRTGLYKFNTDKEDLLFPLASHDTKEVMLLLDRIREILFYHFLCGDSFDIKKEIIIDQRGEKREKVNMVKLSQDVLKRITSLNIPINNGDKKVTIQVNSLYKYVSRFPQYCEAVLAYDEQHKAENENVKICTNVPEIRHFEPGAILAGDDIFAEISYLVEKSFRNSRKGTNTSPIEIEQKDLYIYVEGSEIGRLESLFNSLSFLKRHINVHLYVHSSEAEACLKNNFASLSEFGNFSVHVKKPSALSSSRILVLFEKEWLVSIDCFRNGCCAKFSNEGIESAVATLSEGYDEHTSLTTEKHEFDLLSDNPDYLYVISKGFNPVFLSPGDYRHALDSVKPALSEEKKTELEKRFNEEHNSLIELLSNKKFIYREYIMNSFKHIELSKYPKVNLFFSHKGTDLFPFVSDSHTVEWNVFADIVKGYYIMNNTYISFSCRFLPENSGFLNVSHAELTDRGFTFAKSDNSFDKKIIDTKINYHLGPDKDSALMKAQKSLFNEAWDKCDYQLNGDADRSDPIDTSDKLRSIYQTIVIY